MFQKSIKFMGNYVFHIPLDESEFG